MLGFVRLARLEVGRATEAFERAIALDPAAPLPRLGLGLARIRRGDLSGGRQELEIAVALDPGDALLRSYLGKAYYEERRPQPAASQLDRAEALDPTDPTAYLYNAVLLQSVNRPVAALDALERSIERNDNRAIYRSRLLLDADRATRSVNLGRIYDDLGFEQLALLEGYRSLAEDPTSDSAHRFLSDAYAAVPRHEMARVSEVLQSQLYQPLNLHPVPPQIAFSEPAVLGVSGLSRAIAAPGSAAILAAGPGDPAFNEFNQLFERNGLSILASGLVGSNETYADQVVLSALHGPFSISVGQLHSETQGFRPNNDLTRDAYNVLAQLAVGPGTSLLAELRYDDIEQGDLVLAFDPENFDPKLRQKDQIRSARLGARHAFTPGSELIGTVAYLDGEFSASFGPDIDIKTDLRAWVGELQHAFRWRRLRLVSGVGHVDGDRTDVLRFINSEKQDDISIDRFEDEFQRTNGYLYALLRWPDPVTWTLGLSADRFKSGDAELQSRPDQPEAWHPLDADSRHDASRGDLSELKGSLVSNQTIEPTQVAGFNQFFDDFDGTDAWRYGVGVDQKLGSRAAVGAEFSARELTVPFLEFTREEAPITRRATWRSS